MIRIVGLDEVNAGFTKIDKKSDSFMTREIHRAATRIAKGANKDVPIDTGALLRSIKVTKNNKFAEVAANEKYAGFVEQGTKKMSKQPYFFKHVDPSINVMIKNIKRLITL